MINDFGTDYTENTVWCKTGVKFRVIRAKIIS